MFCRSDAIADGQPSLAFSSASVYCKTALHLQLTTALVSAATQPHARLHHEHDSAQLMSGMGDAGPSTADGIDNGCADGDSPVHMWRSVGEEAVHDVLADAAKLLSCLQSVGAENLTGECSPGGCCGQACAHLSRKLAESGLFVARPVFALLPFYV